jgi:hypothetical protein
LICRNFIFIPKVVSENLVIVVRYNAIQERIINIILKAGPFRGWTHELIVMLLSNKKIKAKINNSFS